MRCERCSQCGDRGCTNSSKGATALALGAAAAGAALGAYFLLVRPWHLRWGASDEEARGPLPGDEWVPRAAGQSTHAVTVRAPQAAVWPWLVQVGQGRGGFYSYSWLENLFGLHIHNVRRIEPGLQELKQGDFVPAAPPTWLGGRLAGIAGWDVVVLEPGRALVLRSPLDGSSWALVLKPHPSDPDATRLIARGRSPAGRHWAMTPLDLVVGEPAHFIMERKMLLTLKWLAEAAGAPPAGAAAPAPEPPAEPARASVGGVLS